jgi:hypothetical protein
MLAQQGRSCSARSTQFELRRPRVNHGNVSRQRGRQGLMDAILQHGFAPVALQQILESGFAFEDLMESAHGTVSVKRSATGVRDRTQGRNVI